MKNMDVKSPYVVNLNNSRGYGGLEHLTSKWDIDAWVGLETRFQQRNYVFDNRTITVTVDWSNAIEKAKTEHWLCQQSLKAIDSYYESKAGKHHIERTECPVYVIDSNNEVPLYAETYIEYYLYECFLLMNLCSPGSFNLFMSYIYIPEAHRGTMPDRDRVNMTTSEYIFETALHNAYDNDWPNIGHIDFDIVISWYLNQSEYHPKQLAKTRIDKVLFSLLHLCQTDSPQDRLMWEAYSLESLYDTPNVMSYNSLVSRVTDLLNVPESKRKKLAKMIRNFYDFRNSFAHGKSKVVHPMGHEGWDKDLDDHKWKLLLACDFASMITIASLQYYISNNINEIHYSEVRDEIKFQI